MAVIYWDVFGVVMRGFCKEQCAANVVIYGSDTLRSVRLVMGVVNYRLDYSLCYASCNVKHPRSAHTIQLPVCVDLRRNSDYFPIQH
jgi:hypothetical protein